MPDYQRDLVWPPKHQCRFIESILIGLPIPFLFVADAEKDDDPDSSGRLEIVDGVQRIRTLANFMTGELVLNDLDKLKSLTGFRFFDLSPPRQRRFRRITMRLIELGEGVGEEVRRDLFDRINTGSMGLEAVEVRRGMAPGPFVDLTTELARDPLFRSLTPVSDALAKRFEYEELITRFFAFTDRFEDYGTGPEGKVVKDFLLSYVQDMNVVLGKADGTGEARKQAMQTEWMHVLDFVNRHVPNGFRKAGGAGKKVPRVRFEAIAVGIALALRTGQNINVDRVREWINCDKFKELLASDAANNRANFRNRIGFVRDMLLS